MPEVKKIDESKKVFVQCYIMGCMDYLTYNRSYHKNCAPKWR